jgi:hypothetical protein
MVCAPFCYLLCNTTSTLSYELAGDVVQLCNDGAIDSLLLRLSFELSDMALSNLSSEMC